MEKNMNIKIILYILVFPLSIWALESIRINGILKKERELQARVLYLMCSFGLSYLVVNFLYDFFIYSKFV